MQMINFINGTTLFPQDMCTKEGIPNFQAFAINNMDTDLGQNMGALFKNIQEGKMSNEVLAIINAEVFPISFLASSISDNITYQKYIYLYKIFFFDWVAKGSYSSASDFFYGYIVPNFLSQISFSGITQVYAPVDTIGKNEYRSTL